MRYEEAIPLGKGHCYHRFTDEGICIRCGEDAEEWDAGCVEEVVEDLQFVTTREFAESIEVVLVAAGFGGELYSVPVEHMEIVRGYLTKIEKLHHKWGSYFAEEPDVVDVADGTNQPDGDDAADSILDL